MGFRLRRTTYKISVTIIFAGIIYLVVFRSILDNFSNDTPKDETNRDEEDVFININKLVTKSLRAGPLLAAPNRDDQTLETYDEYVEQYNKTVVINLDVHDRTSSDRVRQLDEENIEKQRQINAPGEVILYGELNVKAEPHPPQPAPIPNGPGENGEGVHINETNLTPEEKERYDAGWKNNAYNEYASDMISVNRTLADLRNPECKTMTYDSDLPDASVIITFHNEAWSVLLRSVHSVLNRSPPHLLKELILVDDFSDTAHLQRPLEEYMQQFRKVKIMRTSKREGLIRARLLGYSGATGIVLVFLDSHIECVQGWLEPLLERINRNKTTVVAPVIDSITDGSLKYLFGSTDNPSVGGFEWSLTFTWHAIPKSEMERRQYKKYLPIRTPTIAGGLFAISREYFTYLGTYDEGMDIWGAENLEISFRIWMCGGTLEIHPCSHVGHIFRKRSPYVWPRNDAATMNSIRLAEVWLDDYKYLYYLRLGAKFPDFGDVTARKELRTRLQCKSFDWYLKNVYPELEVFDPFDALGSGEIANKARPICLDSGDQHAHLLIPYPCHHTGHNQFWIYTKDKTIRVDRCFDYTSTRTRITLDRCHGEKGNQEWEYREDNSIYHVNSGRCITLSMDGKLVTMEECKGTNNQLWIMDRNPPKRRNLDRPTI